MMMFANQPQVRISPNFPPRELTEPILQEFNRLRQEGLVIDYQAKFEKLKFLMLNRNPGLTKDYFVSSFKGGLNDELRLAIQVLRPRTVPEAAEGVYLQEMTFDALMRKQKRQIRRAQRGMIYQGGRPPGREIMRMGLKVGYLALPTPPLNMQNRDKMME